MEGARSARPRRECSIRLNVEGGLAGPPCLRQGQLEPVQAGPSHTSTRSTKIRAVRGRWGQVRLAVSQAGGADPVNDAGALEVSERQRTFSTSVGSDQRFPEIKT